MCVLECEAMIGLHTYVCESEGVGMRVLPPLHYISGTITTFDSVWKSLDLCEVHTGDDYLENDSFTQSPLHKIDQENFIFHVVWRIRLIDIGQIRQTYPGMRFFQFNYIKVLRWN